MSEESRFDSLVKATIERLSRREIVFFLGDDGTLTVPEQSVTAIMRWSKQHGKTVGISLSAVEEAEDNAAVIASAEVPYRSAAAPLTVEEEAEMNRLLERNFWGPGNAAVVASADAWVAAQNGSVGVDLGDGSQVPVIVVVGEAPTDEFDIGGIELGEAGA